MIKIYDIYKDGDNTNNCMPTLTAFVSHNLESLKEMVPKKTQSTLYDLTAYKRSENYILTYSLRKKFYCLNTVENFIEKKSPRIKWIHIGSIK